MTSTMTNLSDLKYRKSSTRRAVRELSALVLT